MWPLFLVNYDYIRASRRDRGEIWVRYLVALAARHVNFVGHKRYSVIEFANGFDDHKKKLLLTADPIKRILVQSSI